MALATNAVFAQIDSVVATQSASPVVIGISGGYGRAFFDSDITTHSDYGLMMAFGEYSTGDVTTMKLGLWIDIPFSGSQSSFPFATGSLAYSKINGVIHDEGDELPYLDESGNVAFTVLVNNLDIQLNQIDATIGIGYQLSSFAIDLSAVIDVSFDSRTTSSATLSGDSTFSFHDVDQLPPDVTVSEDGKTLYFRPWENDKHTSPLFGIQLALKYIINIDPVQIQIAPYYRYYFGSIHTDGTTRMSAAAFEVKVGI